MSYPKLSENMIRNLPRGRNFKQAKRRHEKLLTILVLLINALNSYSRCMKKRALKGSIEDMGITEHELRRYLTKLKELGCIEIMDDDIWITDFGMRCGMPILIEKLLGGMKWSRHQKNLEEKHEPTPKFETVIVPLNLGKPLRPQPLQQQQQVRHCPQCNSPISIDRNACLLCGRQVPINF